MSDEGLRGLRNEDVAPLVELVRSTGAFRPGEVDVARELMDEALQRGESSGYLFVLAGPPGRPLGYACYGPTPCTEATFDLYWIAVSPGEQGQGLATLLLGRVERELEQRSGRLLVVETEEAQAYEPARSFYRARGFREVARVPDFYRPGCAKLIYTKPVRSTGG